MTGVKLTERIRYIHCEDPEGNHGVLVLLGNEDYPTRTFEVNDQTDFRIGFRNLASAEQRQALHDLVLA